MQPPYAVSWNKTGNIRGDKEGKDFFIPFSRNFYDTFLI